MADLFGDKPAPTVTLLYRLASLNLRRFVGEELCRPSCGIVLIAYQRE